MNKLEMQKTKWQFDLYTVVIHETKKKAVLYPYENLVL